MATDKSKLPGLDLVLGERPIWTPYKLIKKPGGFKKLPTDLHGHPLEWNDPGREFWTYAEARDVAGHLNLPGIGLFTDGDVGGVDLDHCIVSGNILPAALRILEKIGTYTERSPSGNGIHAVFFRNGNGSHRGVHQQVVEWGAGHTGRAEVYLERHFLTFTGTVLDGRHTLATLDDMTLLWLRTEIDNLKTKATRKSPPVATNSKVAERVDGTLPDSKVLEIHRKDRGFENYWNGNPAGLCDPSRSGIRFALMCRLVFTCGTNAAQAQHIAEQSPFYASLDDEGRADWARLFAKEYQKAQGINRVRYGDKAYSRNSETASNTLSSAVPKTDAKDWTAKLICNDQGKPIKKIENFHLCLSENPAWAGTIQLDEFRNRIVITDAAPRSIPRGFLSDHAEIMIRCWCDRHFISASKDMIHDAIESAAHEHAFHPVRDWLRSLPAWDGTVHPATFFQTYFGVNDHGNEGLKKYLIYVAIMFGVSAVARVFQPGCQADHMPVLEGPQGIGKSTSLRALFGNEWFTDQMPKSLNNKDSSLQLDGKWCVEFAEIALLMRQDVDTVKSFLSRQEDYYRSPFCRVPESHPRQTVFVGTVNLEEYLVDEENRRAWPVRCGVIDVAAITRDRDQIWAMFVKLYDGGEKWHPDPQKHADLCQIIKTQQDERRVENPLEGALREWLGKVGGDPRSLTTNRILTAWKVPVERWKSMQMQVADAMKRLGYEKDRTGRGTTPYWRKRIGQ